MGACPHPRLVDVAGQVQSPGECVQGGAFPPFDPATVRARASLQPQARRVTNHSAVVAVLTFRRLTGLIELWRGLAVPGRTADFANAVAWSGLEEIPFPLQRPDP